MIESTRNTSATKPHERPSAVARSTETASSCPGDSVGKGFLRKLILAKVLIICIVGVGVYMLLP